MQINIFKICMFHCHINAFVWKTQNYWFFFKTTYFDDFFLLHSLTLNSCWCSTCRFIFFVACVNTWKVLFEYRQCFLLSIYNIAELAAIMLLFSQCIFQTFYLSLVLSEILFSHIFHNFERKYVLAFSFLFEVHWFCLHKHTRGLMDRQTDRWIDRWSIICWLVVSELSDVSSLTLAVFSCSKTLNAVP